jgi:hypothetical protein
MLFQASGNLRKGLHKLSGPTAGLVPRSRLLSRDWSVTAGAFIRTWQHLVGLFSFIDVIEEIHHANNRAVIVANGINVHGNYNAASIRPFDDDFLFAYQDTRP